jgi:8-oxo-dGTP diphosphatase
MSIENERPRIGVGVYVRKDGRILMGKRKGVHGGGQWCAPGGKLDMYESPEECAHREIREEAGIEIDNVHFMTITNDIFKESGLHYITLAYTADWVSGEVRVVEPDKCEEWGWYGLDDIPEPRFTPLSNFLKTGYNPLNI